MSKSHIMSLINQRNIGRLLTLINRPIQINVLGTTTLDCKYS